MPFTLSHPAAVMPLRRIGLPMTSMVAGSTVLDIPLYLGSRRGYDIAHSPLGVPTVDIIGALAALWFWFAFLRDPLTDLAPGPIRSRVAPHARLTQRQWMLAPIGVLIGATTHVVWDSFTHDDTWGYRQVNWLQADHLGVAGLRWAQYVSAIGGLTVIVAFAVAYLRRLPVRYEQRRARTLPAYALPAVFAIAGTVALVTGLAKAPVGMHAVAFFGAVSGFITLTVGIFGVCAAWHVARKRSQAAPMGEA